MDGDGDQDVLAIIFQEGLIWFENTDGQGTFNSGTIIDIDSEFLTGLSIFDLDNDGDQDIISAFNNGPATLIWYENLDGLGDFDTSKEIYQFAYFSGWTAINSIVPVDINNDGKIDILFDSAFEDIDVLDLNIYWIENLDNQGLFDTPVHISNQYTAAGSLRAFDLDNDGDQDVLAAHYDDVNSKISWYKNTDGAGLFTSEQIITTQVERVYEANAGDINNDGLLDVISASSSDYKIAWYENGVLGINDNTKQTAILYPNPTNNTVSILSNLELENIKVFNVLGKKIFSQNHFNEIDFSKLETGIYFVKLIDKDGNINTYKIIKK
ncbi:MAG: T9SS type A sorting domain-containing protein [Flavobacteriaceae bacterium]|nr:T9SS type A sorting domain-containing protein [Flavobacteriaceae bacterium]